MSLIWCAYLLESVLTEVADVIVQPYITFSLRSRRETGTSHGPGALLPCLLHLEQWNNLFEDIARVLKPGGAFEVAMLIF
jgi:hypothetical protein